MGKSWGKLTVMQNPLCENPPGKMTFRIFYEYPETILETNAFIEQPLTTGELIGLS